jgi:hypothetical protein
MGMGIFNPKGMGSFDNPLSSFLTSPQIRLPGTMKDFVPKEDEVSIKYLLLTI